MTVTAPRSTLPGIRDDMISASYGICIQKAELMTRAFVRREKRRPLLNLIKRIHYRAYSASLLKLARGEELPRWKNRLNAKLVSLYRKIEGRSPGEMAITHAEAFREIVANQELRVWPGERIVGNLSSRRVGAPLHPDFGGLLMLGELDSISSRRDNPMELSPEDAAKLKKEIFPFWFDRSILATTPLYARESDFLAEVTRGSAFILTQFSGISHLTPDYPTVLEKGFEGIEADLLREREKKGETPFLQAALIVTRSAVEFQKRWRAHLLSEAEKEVDSGRRAELSSMADIFDRVPGRPTETFHEALQSLFAAHVLVHQENFQHGVSFGRVDQYLYPYYSKDIASGRISREEAIELIGCFLAKAAELLPLFFDRATEYFSGLSSASGLTLGGTKSDGTDGTNELSELFLLAYDRMRLRQPNIHVRWHPGIDAGFLDLCWETVRKGGGMPAIFNDERIVPAIGSDDYSIVGCAEWGVPHESFPAAGAGFINLPHVLLLALHDGTENGRRVGPATGRPADMEELREAYRIQLRHLLRRATDGNNAIETAHARHRPTPFLSTIVGGCVESGVELNAGGARRNQTGFQGVGLADVADSFSAIEEIVFRDGVATWEEMVAAVDRNFEGDGELRARILNRVSRYGESEANGYARFVSESFSEELSAFTNPRGGRYVAGFWTMTTHQGFGRRTRALPSGRLAGESLSNGISPVQGCERRGPTATLSSAAANVPVGNGCVLNLKMSPDHLRGEKGKVVLNGLVRGYFAKGGQQVQFNVLDPQVLIEAKKDPGKYRDLVVRISGYSAYFNDLTEALKDEIIARALHGS